MEINKKGQGMIPLPFIIILIGLLIFVYLENQETEEICLDNNIPEDICIGSGTVSCYLDCNSLDKIYFKYDSGALFASSDCFCKDEDNEVKQIY